MTNHEIGEEIGKEIARSIAQKIAMGIALLFGFAFLIIFGGFVVQWLWNWLVPGLFGLRQLTIWEALGLLALSRILFGGWGRGGGGPHHRSGRGEWWKKRHRGGETAPPANAAALAQAQKIYADLTKGTIDRSLFTPSANAFFTVEVLADYAASLGPLGAASEFTAGGDALRGGMTIRNFRIRAGGVLLDVSMMVLPDGKIDQFIVSRAG